MKLHLAVLLISLVACVKCRTEKPVITSAPQPQTVFERHGTAEFKCEAKGSGRLKYHWYAKSVNLENEIKKDTKYMKLSHHGKHLTIVKPRRTLAGMYYCAVSSSTKGQGEPKGAMLTVTYAVDNIAIKPRATSLTRVEGGELTMRCTSNSNPPALYRWFHVKQTSANETRHRPIGKLSHSGTLSLHYLTKNMIGRYTCMALNYPNDKHPKKVSFRKTSFDLTVQYGPYDTKFTVNGDDKPYVHADEGDKVTISCHSDTNPPSAYKITKDGSTTALNQDPSIGSYTIKKMSDADVGEYHCTSYNPVTKKVENKKTNVFIKGPCSDDPCKNGAECQVLDLQHYVCKCKEGYLGKHCQHAPCIPQPCKNNGTCHIVSETEHKCECPIGYNGEHCGDQYRPVGCFYDDIHNRAIPDLILNVRSYIHWDNLDLTVKNCSSYAKSLGYSVFSVQFYGECWSGPNTEVTYNKYGPAENCWHGVGVGLSNFVYYNIMEKKGKEAPKIRRSIESKS